jgi:flavodoxin
MTRTLVVCHSRTGNTRRVAKAIAARLRADVEEIRIVQPIAGAIGYAFCAIEAIAGLAPALRPSRRAPSRYDCIVVGTPVWFWSLASPVRSWLARHRVAGKRVAFFCTMGGSGAERVFATMAGLAGTAPVATMALTDDEIERGADAKIDAFVAALSRKRETAVVPTRRKTPGPRPSTTLGTRARGDDEQARERLR